MLKKGLKILGLIVGIAVMVFVIYKYSPINHSKATKDIEHSYKIDNSKVDAKISLLYREMQNINESTSGSDSTLLEERVNLIYNSFKFLVPMEKKSNDFILDVWIRTTDGGLELRNSDICVTSTLGELSTAFLPLSKVPEVSNLNSVIYVKQSALIESSGHLYKPRLTPQNDLIDSTRK